MGRIRRLRLKHVCREANGVADSLVNAGRHFELGVPMCFAALLKGFLIFCSLISWGLINFPRWLLSDLFVCVFVGGQPIFLTKKEKMLIYPK